MEGGGWSTFALERSPKRHDANTAFIYSFIHYSLYKKYIRNKPFQKKEKKKECLKIKLMKYKLTYKFMNKLN